MDASVTLVEVNNQMIQAMEGDLAAEAQEDAALATQLGPKYTRVPSQQANVQYATSLADYKAKMGQAAATDLNIKQKFEANKQGFGMLSKSRQDIAALIPAAAAGASIDQNPAVVAIRSALEEIDGIGAQKDTVMQEGVAMMDNFNAVDECLAVHRGTMDKAAVFEQYRK